ncbi:hypothetical protein [Flavobacterium sp.]|jgi:tetratricopeptide (TPR) repeat protein|uniref:hypothetical protein n=1 Tax=Flavobacterium sp. TaxID=239 RepID=UPI0037BE8C0A
MKKFILSLVSLLLFYSCGVFKKSAIIQPKWVNESYRAQFFPDDEYYIYFEEKNIKEFTSQSTKDIKLEFGRELKNQLVKQIVEKISFSTTSSELQTENNKIDYISSVLRESSQTATATLIGSREEYYIDNKMNSISAIIYVKKSILAKGYSSILNSKIELLKGKIDQYIKYDSSEENSPLNSINLELISIQNEMEIYAILVENKDSELINKYNNMYESYRVLNSKFGNDANKIESLINQADELYLAQAGFESILAKLNEALLYDATNAKVINKKNEYKNRWVSVLTSDLNSKISIKEYQSAISIIDKLLVVDPNNENVYAEKKRNIIVDYFRFTLTNIKKLINNGSLFEAIKQLNQISKYAYVDIKEFEKIKSEIENISIDNAISVSQNYIFEKKYDEALNHCKQNLILYPTNRELQKILNEVLELISKKKKLELLQSRPTRYVFEINYSLSHLPLIVQDKNIEQNDPIDFSNVDFGNKLGCFQFGLYRKVNIKLKEVNFGKNSKFHYSQLGLRTSFLDLSNNLFYDDNGIPFSYGKSNIMQIEASFIWRRFFMFNLGYLKETLPLINANTTITGLENNYFCSSIGIRIPFDFIHLTADVTGYSDSGKIIKAYAKAGVSINIGFSKKYNLDDEKYIENELISLKNK